MFGASVSGEGLFGHGCYLLQFASGASAAAPSPLCGPAEGAQCCSAWHKLVSCAKSGLPLEALLGGALCNDKWHARAPLCTFKNATRPEGSLKAGPK